MANVNPVVHVIDDDTSMRESLCRLLGSFGFDVREYASAGEFLLSWPVDLPGCLLLDVNMPGPSGMDLQRALSQRSDAPPVVFLSGYGDIAMSVLAMKRGAVDFLTKPVERETLLAAVTLALEIDVARRADDIRQQAVRNSYASLTARESEIFSQVVAGRLNKQIADAIGTCERTVKAHRANLMEKLGARSVAELIYIAVQLQPGTLPAPTGPEAAGSRSAPKVMSFSPN